jgi:hypothetical protein
LFDYKLKFSALVENGHAVLLSLGQVLRHATQLNALWPYGIDAVVTKGHQFSPNALQFVCSLQVGLHQMFYLKYAYREKEPEPTKLFCWNKAASLMS